MHFKARNPFYFLAVLTISEDGVATVSINFFCNKCLVQVAPAFFSFYEAEYLSKANLSFKV
jgi:hypothetical protein